MLKHLLGLLLIGFTLCSDPAVTPNYYGIVSKAPFFNGEWKFNGGGGQGTNHCYPDGTVTFSKVDDRHINMKASSTSEGCDGVKEFILPFPIMASYLQLKEMNYLQVDSLDMGYDIAGLKVNGTKKKDDVEIQFSMSTSKVGSRDWYVFDLVKYAPKSTFNEDFPVPAIPVDYRKKESGFFLGDWQVYGPYGYNAKNAFREVFGNRQYYECCMPVGSLTFTKHPDNSSQIQMKASKWVGSKCEGYHKDTVLDVPIPETATHDYIPIKNRFTSRAILDLGAKDNSTVFGTRNYKAHHMWTDNTGSRQETFEFAIGIKENFQSSEICRATLLRDVNADKFDKEDPNLKDPALPKSIPITYLYGVQAFFGDDKMDDNYNRNLVLGLSSSQNIIGRKRSTSNPPENIVFPLSDDEPDIEVGTEVDMTIKPANYPTFKVDGVTVNAKCTMQKGLWKTSLETDRFTIVNTSRTESYTDYDLDSKDGILGMGIEGDARKRFHDSVKAFGIKLKPLAEFDSSPVYEKEKYVGELIFNPNVANSGMSLHSSIDSNHNWWISRVSSVSLGEINLNMSVSDTKIVYDLNHKYIRVPKNMTYVVMEAFKAYDVTCEYFKMPGGFHCTYARDATKLPPLTFDLGNEKTLNIWPEQYMNTDDSEYKPGDRFSTYISNNWEEIAPEFQNTFILGRCVMRAGLTVFNFEKEQPQIQFYSKMPSVREDTVKLPKPKPWSIFDEWWFYALVILGLIVIGSAIYCCVAARNKKVRAQAELNGPNQYANLVNSNA